MQHVTIIIPTYNEEKTLGSTIENLFHYLPISQKYEFTILIFDSNSSDNTVTKVKEIQKNRDNVLLLQESQKSGLGSAYIQAMQYAITTLKTDIIFEYDADGSHQPKFIPEMLDALKECDCVVGSRYVPGGSVDKDWGFYRRLLSKGASILSQLFLSMRYKDYTSGFRATKTNFLKRIDLPNLYSKQYAYKIHLFWALHKAGAKIVEHPISFIDRKEGYSKLPRFNIAESILVLTKLRLVEMRRFIKVCLCGTSGMLVQFILFNILRLHMHETFAVILSVEAAIITNFFAHNTISFRDTQLLKSDKVNVWLNRFVKFNGLSLFSLCLQTITMHIGITILGSSWLIANVLLILGMLLGAVTNYFSYKTFVWKV